MPINRIHIATSAFVYFSVIMLLLDLFNTVGRATAPQTLSNFACSILPITTISSPLVASNLIDYAKSQCMVEAHEPAISIIFFMFKIVLFYAAVLSLIMAVFLNYKKVEGEFFDYIKTQGGVVPVLKNVGATIVGLGLLGIYLFMQLEKEPLAFSSDIFSKPMEDFSCLILMVVSSLLILNSFFLWRYTTIQNSKK